MRAGAGLSGEKEVWFIAGGAPHTKDFGRFIQTLRQRGGLSVGDVANAASLGVGTLRAIEQGRRAPSEDSGIRLLDALLSDHDWVTNDRDRSKYVIRQTNPERVIGLRFGAKRQGDNNRWTKISNKESLKALVTLADSLDLASLTATSNWDSVVTALSSLAREVEPRLRASANVATDEEVGNVLRRLVTMTSHEVDVIRQLFWLWDQSRLEEGSGEATSALRDVNRALRQVTPFIGL